jgi:putative addiction module killer protein
MKQIKIFKLNNGKEPLKIWLKSLDSAIQRRIINRFDKIDEGNLGDFKIIDNEIKELRFKFGSGYRIYFHETNNAIILLISGGDKSTQSKDIVKAKEYLKIWKEQKNG